MSTATIDELKLYTMDGRTFVYAPIGRGEDLLIHLASYGIGSQLSMITEGPLDQLEILGNVDSVAHQAIVDDWQR